MGAGGGGGDMVLFSPGLLGSGAMFSLEVDSADFMTRVDDGDCLLLGEKTTKVNGRN